MTRDIHLVAYVDGSSRPTNPGYSGFGIYGYTLKPSKRPNKTKHPVHAKYNFTSTGVQTTPDPLPFETINILEHIGSINNPKGTNNLAEMVGFIKVLELTLTHDDISKVYAITDSEYVVTNFKENLARWKSTGWKRADGKPVVHVQEWETIDRLSNQLKELGVEVEAVWVKGHSDDYGNGIADLYASIGSNYARQQIEENVPTFNEVAFHQFSPYKDYKASLADKDIVFYFRDLFFSSSDKLEDVNYCFLTTTEDPSEVGKRNTSSIFLTNIGYVPPMINTIKSIFRSFSRDYITNCCIRLNRIKDKEVLRLTQLVGIEKMLVKVTNHTGTHLFLIKDTAPFVMEYTYDYPYTVEASKVFNASLDSYQGHTVDSPWLVSKDITDLVLKEGKLNFTNKDNQLDLNTYFDKDYTFIHSLLAKVGYDLPNFLALKSIEGNIQKVTAVTELQPDTNHLSLYIMIHLTDRVLCSVNILNKFLVKR